MGGSLLLAHLASGVGAQYGRSAGSPVSVALLAGCGGLDVREFLSKYLPIGEYRTQHWMDYDHRGAWLIPVCVGAAFLAVWVPFFLVVPHGL